VLKQFHQDEAFKAAKLELKGSQIVIPISNTTENISSLHAAGLLNNGSLPPPGEQFALPMIKSEAGAILLAAIKPEPKASASLFKSEPL